MSDSGRLMTVEPSTGTGQTRDIDKSSTAASWASANASGGRGAHRSLKEASLDAGRRMRWAATGATITTVVIFLTSTPRPGCRRCTHPWDIHQHYRRGTSCSTPGCSCRRYRTPWWGRLARVQGRAPMTAPTGPVTHPGLRR